MFRQRDPEFVDMLNAMRFGKLDPAMIMQLRQLSRAVKYDDGIEPADLYVYLDYMRYETAANLFHFIT